MVVGFIFHGVSGHFMFLLSFKSSKKVCIRPMSLVTLATSKIRRISFLVRLKMS